MATRGNRAGIGPSTPSRDAAAETLRLRIDVVRRLVAKVRNKLQSGAGGVKEVHQLRVACRRASAAVQAFGPTLPSKPTKKLRKGLAEIRRVAGFQRDRDVLIERLTEWVAHGPKRYASRHRAMIKSLRADEESSEKLMESVSREAQNRLRKQYQRTIIEDPSSEHTLNAAGAETLAELARQQVAAAMLRADECSAKGLTNNEQAHALRVAIKRLRYMLETFAPCMDAKVWRRSLAEISHVQEVMGIFNDQATVLVYVKAYAFGPSGRQNPQQEGGTNADLLLIQVHEARTSELRENAVAAWRVLRSGDSWRQLSRWTLAGESPALGFRGSSKGLSAGMLELKPAGAQGQTASTQTIESPDRVVDASKGRRATRARLAAIDVGSNSLRLIVAETAPDGSYRILDDEKETTRLGRGLHDEEKMSESAIEHSAVTIERMVLIAKGYGAEEIRIVGTAAAREARNAEELIGRVKARTGLTMNVITAAEEAQFAYRSASRAFDLSEVPAIVLDIGGASTEVVLSVGRAVPGRGAEGTVKGSSGVIEQIYTIPMGAVRLTEKFGGDVEATGKRFEEMTKFVKGLVREHVGRPPVVPQLLIGTGGTVTALGAIMAQRDAGSAAGGLFPGSLQGIEVKRSDVKHLIEHLRNQPLKQRSKMPGLSAERADIIVAGFVVLDAIMKRFRCNTVRVHEGGIRDGLLLSMAAERYGRRAQPADRVWDSDATLKGVRRFARACSYERAHSEHVTSLAVSLFDQLMAINAELAVEGAAIGSRERLLLEAAAVLHDVGYLINYAQHHKHSYHLIVHADLPGLTTREVQVIANVARYHRAAGPKAKHAAYRAMNRADRRMVDVLSGILRIADGLDRSHTQTVRGVTLRLDAEELVFAVRANEEPAVDMWGAQRKCEVFERATGRKTRFEWERAPSISNATGLSARSTGTATTQG